ncbi:Arc family DNA-binding protein [Gluconobacter sp. R75690]|uniref:Arc family DNA-binding protein n=1 Tax=unclassified Gluconobacter TaxID=2644261 RepID=UPI00188A125A|nr:MULTISPECIES: Arc family DNA-binding protein [unclassified Gluconobacter]MBF0851023.1 Arc family DNA-binding protein [Gluconobacter sp. R75690]MBF0879715.1 Arc family DNA-binding protein [Gluconobacter sp. R75828]
MNHEWFIDAREKMDHGPFMAATDPQMKIRLPAFLKDELSKHAKNRGMSMNQAIIDLLQDALAEFPAGIPKLKVIPEDNRNAIEKEIDFISLRINSLNDDFFELTNSLNNLNKLEDIESRTYRGYLINQILETNNELEDLNKKLRILEARLKSI